MVKNPPANAGDPREAGSIPGWGRSSGGGHGNLLQCSCLENPMDRGVWVTKSRTQPKQLSMHAPPFHNLLTPTRTHTIFPKFSTENSTNLTALEVCFPVSTELPHLRPDGVGVKPCPKSQTCELNNCCCFKPMSFGVFRYAATGTELAAAELGRWVGRRYLSTVGIGMLLHFHGHSPP